MAIGLEGEKLLAVVSIFDRGPSADVLSARLERDRIRNRNNRAKHRRLNGGAKANDVATIRKTSADASADGADERHESTSLLPVFLPEKSLQAVSKKEVNGRARGTRLLADAKLGQADREFAAKHGADPEKLWAEFIDFWIGVPGARGLKINWSSTWRNRVRAVTGQTGAPNGHAKKQRTVQDAATDLLARVRGFDEPAPGGVRRGTGEDAPRLLSKG